ncbi:MAG: single-stranded-DNA-specific exonuclease RecJ [Minisyncoccota bacterium]
MKKYVIRENISDNVKENLKSYHPLLQELLFARGIRDHIDAELFISPDFSRDIHDPYLLKDMKKTVERILQAFEAGERIGIFSDYDADGIPGAVVISDFFKKIGYENYEVYIPHRNDEGYGMSHDATDLFKKNKVTLMITIDCGIADVKEVAYANSLGIDVIVTDHHLPHEILPDAFAIINPKQNDCEYPEKMLCGSGVIWKVICAILQNKNFKEKYSVTEGWEKWLLDMVGLATLSDMVPLRGENRVLASYGLYVIRKSPRPGLQKLCQILKMNQAHLTEEDIGFMITPRINAASRMGVPRDAFVMLSETDPVKAGIMAEHLNKINDERKGVVASMVKEIKKIIGEREDVLGDVIVLGNPKWKPSLLGLVANSFGDEHGRPVFLWGRGEEKDGDGHAVLKGSCRAGGDTNIVKLMEHAKDCFVDFGGHAGAGGFSVSLDEVATLEKKLNKAFEELKNELSETEAIMLDKEISIDDVEWGMYSHIEKLSPFGMDNLKPLFLISDAVISSMKQFGKEKNHLELTFHKKNGKSVQAIGFFSDPSKYRVSLEVGQKINLIAHIEKSMFRNFPELRLRIVDVI